MLLKLSRRIIPVRSLLYALMPAKWKISKPLIWDANQIQNESIYNTVMKPYVYLLQLSQSNTNALLMKKIRIKIFTLTISISLLRTIIRPMYHNERPQITTSALLYIQYGSLWMCYRGPIRLSEGNINILSACGSSEF